jgi:hypothetical protein
MADQAVARKEIPPLYEYWKAPTITNMDITVYHDAGWLLGVLLCSTTSLDFPTIDRTNTVYFESHMMCGSGLPPSKFFCFYFELPWVRASPCAPEHHYGT